MAEHLYILSPEERYQIYALPIFNEEQRQLYLTLNTYEQTLLEQYSTPLSQVYFALQLGYFKAKQQFFLFDLSDVPLDTAYLQTQYFSEKELPVTGRISKPTRLAQQKVILELYDYQLANESIRRDMFHQACELATRHSSAVFIFRELVNWLEKHRIVLPAYTTMQRMIERAIYHERIRLEKLIENLLSEEQRKALEVLLNDQSHGFYLLTCLQQEPANFSNHAMRNQVVRKQALQHLYTLSKKVIPHLGISNESVRYYGSLAIHYTIYQLQQFRGHWVYVLLLCFVNYRYREINDTIVDAFRYYVRLFEDEAQQAAQEFLYRYRLDVNEQMRKVPMILSLFVDDTIDDAIPFAHVKEKVLNLLDAEKIHLLSNYIEDKTVDPAEMRWQHYEEVQRKISYNLRFLFIHLDVESTGSADKVIDAAKIVRRIFASGNRLQQVKTERLSLDFIPLHYRKYMSNQEGVVASRYEMLLYQSVRNAIESGDIFVTGSFEYQSFDQDLIPKDVWQEQKESILKKIDLTDLSLSVEEVLTKWEKILEEKYRTVNKALATGKNPGVRLKTKKKDPKEKWSPQWQLLYEAETDSYNHQLFQQLPLTSIVTILHWVEQQTKFTQAFTHILNRRAAQKPDKERIIASLLALGTNQGIQDMASRSDLGYYDLSGCVHHFLREETLQKANQLIVDCTAALPMFSIYHLQQDTVHSSSDGQKYETRFETVNARYSPKYFGLSKGVTAYTMVANHIPVNAKIIGANEHESHYVFDLLFNNPTTIKSHIHSTDTHGTNQVNFAILDFFGYQFAPRYKQFTTRAESIYSFRSPAHYQQYILKPKRKIKTELIIEEWDNIQRIIASLALKTTTQSTIIRKLSSYSRVNRTQQALWEYDNLVRTDYIFNFIHSQQLRKNVQKALNRGEGYHRLRKAVFFAHEGKFHVHSIAEQQLWSECTRLLANVIIYYNMYLLSALLSFHKKKGNWKDVDSIKRISPVAWRHVNLFGIYQFNQINPRMEFEELVKKIKIKTSARKE